MTTARCSACPTSRRFAAEHGLVLVTIADLIRYRRHREKLVRRVSQARIPTQYGDFTAHVFESLLDGVEHLAFVRGEVAGHDNVLVRVHSECLTGDVFGSMRCDCGTQLDRAMARLPEEDHGVVVYLRGHEGRGIGLGHKLRAYTSAGRGPRHGRGQPRARLPGRLARVRHRRADPRGSRRHDDAADDEQPGEVRRHRGLRVGDRGAGAGADGADCREHRVPSRRSSASSGICSASTPIPTPKTTPNSGVADGRVRSAAQARARRHGHAVRDHRRPLQSRRDRALVRGCREDAARPRCRRGLGGVGSRRVRAARWSRSASRSPERSTRSCASER